MADLMQQTRELLPCPFCGGEAERIDFGPDAAENEGGSCIACKRCQASGPVEFGFKENFIANWNRRAAPEGFVMVPVEPTDELTLRIAKALQASEQLGWTWEDCSPIEVEGWMELANAAIFAMLAARPQGVK